MSMRKQKKRQGGGSDAYKGIKKSLEKGSIAVRDRGSAALQRHVPDKVKIAHKDRSLYFFIAIATLSVVNIGFMIKDLSNKKDNPSEEEKMKIKHALDFSNTMTASIHIVFFMSNLFAIKAGDAMHIQYKLMTTMVVINLFMNFGMTLYHHLDGETLMTNTNILIGGSAIVNIMMFLYRYMKSPPGVSQSEKQ